MPLVSRTFNQLIDFTRTSSATYVDATGKIVPTAASRNRLTFTQEFDNAGWTKVSANAYSFDPATATLGPELVTNGTFGGDSTTGWVAGFGLVNGTFTASGGVATLTQGSSDTTPRFVTTLSGLVIGASYRLSFTAVSQSGVGDKYIVWTGSSNGTGGSTLNQGAGALWNGESRSFVVTATATTMYVAIGIINGTTSSSVSIDNISVKELSGGLIAAPDGTLTADKITPDTNSGTKAVRQIVASSGTNTWSFYAKAAGYTKVGVWDHAITGAYASFNLAGAGSVLASGSGASGATITSVGNGWYRCSFVAAASGNIGFSFQVLPDSYTTGPISGAWVGDGTSGIYLWGAQLEANTTATDYTRNVGGVYPPRFDYDPVTLAPKGLLVEEQRTNLLRYSEQIDNAAWVKQPSPAVSVAANVTTSPDGTVDADILRPATSSSSFHFVSQQPLTLTNAAHTATVYLKAGGYDYAELLIGSDFSYTKYATAYFNLATGAFVTSRNVGYTVTSYSITPVGNGWYRCSLTTTTDANSTSVFTINCGSSSNPLAAFTGDGTSGIYIWGAQLEAGSFATSYIPTVASQVTRTADVATITGANFSQWYNQSEGTFVIEAARGVANVSAYILTASDNTAAEWLGVNFTTSQRIAATIADGSVAQMAVVTANDAAPVNTITDAAIAYKLNDSVFTANGATPTTDTICTIPTTNRLYLGSDVNGAGSILNGHIRSIRYYPTRLSNAQLQALTA